MTKAKTKAPRFEVGDYVVAMRNGIDYIRTHRIVGPVTSQGVTVCGATYRHSGKATSRKNPLSIRRATENESAAARHSALGAACYDAVTRHGALRDMAPDQLRALADLLGVK